MNKLSSTLEQLMAHKKWLDMSLYAMLKTPIYTEHQEAVGQTLYWLNHIHIVDQIFKSHMLRRPHNFTSTENSLFPPLAQLHDMAEDLDEWLVQYTKSLDEAAETELIEFVFTDGSKGCMSRGQMLIHLASHGQYHISASINELARKGLPVPPLLFTSYLNTNLQPQ